MNRRLAFGVLAALVPALLLGSWYDDYDRGLKAAREGNWQVVVEAMTKAIAGNSKEDNKARTYAAIFINYHPYYYRGAALLNLGRYDEAVADLEKASGPGAVNLGTVEALLIQAKASSSPPGATSPSPAPSSSPPAPTSTRLPLPVTASPSLAAPTATRPEPSPEPSTESPLQFAKDALMKANIAFNAPESMEVSSSRVIEMLLDLHLTREELAKQIGETGPVQTARIQVTSTVEAHLTGSAFQIVAVTPEEQAITTNATTQWKWEVTPREAGRQRLFLTVNAIIASKDQREKHSIRSFERMIEVRVAAAPPVRPVAPAETPSRVLPWLVGAVVLLLGGSIVFLITRGKKRDDATVPMPADALSTAKFSIGELVASRYRITKFIGKGGMGAVYAAEDREFGGELVALKTVIGGGDDEQRALTRFKREIQLARRVAHPNVSRMFDVGYHTTSAGRTMFVTMELIEGRTLAQLIREKGRLTEDEALPIIKDIAAGLAATHSAGLIHRDVKSGNVMLTKSGRAVLMDFGLAALAETDVDQAALTATDAVVGSPMYMAPEQIERGALTPATDIYAFGIVIYEMVTGQLPYQSSTPMGVIAKRLSEPPLPPTRFRPDLRPEWTRAILTALERDPARRFQAAEEVVEALSGRDSAELPTLSMPSPES